MATVTIVLKDEYGQDQQYENIDTIAIRDPNNNLQRFRLNNDLKGVLLNAQLSIDLANWHWADEFTAAIRCYQSKQMTLIDDVLEVL